MILALAFKDSQGTDGFLRSQDYLITEMFQTANEVVAAIEVVGGNTNGALYNALFNPLEAALEQVAIVTP